MHIFEKSINWLKSLFIKKNDEEQEKIERLKKHFLSVVVSKSDSEIIGEELNGMPLKIFAQGCALGVSESTMTRVKARNKNEEDEIPYLIYFIIVEPTEKDPTEIKKNVVKKLSETLNYRWCYGEEMCFD